MINRGLFGLRYLVSTCATFGVIAIQLSCSEAPAGTGGGGGAEVGVVPASTPAVVEAWTPPDGDPRASLVGVLRSVNLVPVAEPVRTNDYFFWLAPDATHYARLDKYADGWTLILNGATAASFPRSSTWDFCSWSADGSTFGVVVAKDTQDHRVGTLLLNGRETAVGQWMRALALSSDGKRYGYATAAQTLGRATLYIDGAAVGEYCNVTEIAFSPVTHTPAWVAREPDAESGDCPGSFGVWHGGKKQTPKFKSAGIINGGPRSMFFSPDGRRLAVRGEVLNVPGEQKLVAGYAVMVDGVMGPTFEDVVHSTVVFTPDSADVLYAAGRRRQGDYAVYRNHRPGGKTWNYIAPGSIRLIDQGRRVAYTAYQGPPSRYVADDPTPGFGSWACGRPALVIDDTVVVADCYRWVLSDDGQHMLTVRMTFPNPDAPLGGPMTAALYHDETKVCAVPEPVRELEMRFSPNGQHWAAMIVRHINDGSGSQLVVDHVVQTLPSGTHVHDLSIDDDGRITLVVSLDGSIWWLRSVSGAPVGTPR